MGSVGCKAGERVGSGEFSSRRPCHAEEPEVKPAVLLIVFRQPGANIIDTVDRIVGSMPQLQAEIPAGMHLSVVMDRTATIRASVKDVSSRCCCRSAWSSWWSSSSSATSQHTHPQRGRPRLPIGTFGVMYLLGYSIDNLSLMAMTIATGFVVDDAIVVIENITRHLERECGPRPPPCWGQRRSASPFSRSAFHWWRSSYPSSDGRIVGRLFREFAVTLSVAIGVSMIVSLTTTPMMCATPQAPQRGAPRPALQRQREGLRLDPGLLPLVAHAAYCVTRSSH